MNGFKNLKISKLYNYIIINEKNKVYQNNQKNLSLYNETIYPYELILNNLMIFLYKKLKPILFQEVKTYLNSQYMKYKKKIVPTNIIPNQNSNEVSNSENININISNNYINLSSKKHNKYSIKDIKNNKEHINQRNKINKKEKKIYMPKSEQKTIHSGSNKYNNFEKEKKYKKSTYNKSKNKEIKIYDFSKKYFFSDDYNLFSKKNINNIISIKTLMNNQRKKNKTISKNKILSKSKTQQEHSKNSSNNNSISDSRSLINISNKKINNSKKIISNLFYTSRHFNDNKNIFHNKNKNYNSSKKINNLTKSQPLLNEKLLYQLSFNNNCIYNFNINNGNNNIITHYIENFSKKKNNIQVYKGNINQIFFNKNKTDNKTTIMEKPLLNLIKSKKISYKANSYSTLNKNNVINNRQRNNCINLDLNYKNKIEGIENEINISNKNNLNEEKTTFTENNNNDDNINVNIKKSKLLNEEMMKKIKNTVDDNLKIMFNFSYENFLSKESEQESKEFSTEREKYVEERNYSEERY